MCGAAAEAAARYRVCSQGGAPAMSGEHECRGSNTSTCARLWGTGVSLVGHRQCPVGCEKVVLIASAPGKNEQVEGAAAELGAAADARPFVGSGLKPLGQIGKEAASRRLHAARAVAREMRQPARRSAAGM